MLWILVRAGGGFFPLAVSFCNSSTLWLKSWIGTGRGNVCRDTTLASASLCCSHGGFDMPWQTHLPVMEMCSSHMVFHVGDSSFEEKKQRKKSGSRRLALNILSKNFSTGGCSPSKLQSHFSLSFLNVIKGLTTSLEKTFPWHVL